MEEKPVLKRQLGLTTATLVVVASMIGSGIFILPGLIQGAAGDPRLVMGLWLLGGLVAISGALSYSELATMLPHAGGEYIYIKKAFGELPSFLTGWVSFMVGFAAPAALAALASAEYAKYFFSNVMAGSAIDLFFQNEMNGKLYACFLILMLTLVHMRGVRLGGILQNILTIFKVAVVLSFIGGSAYMIYNGGGLKTADVFQTSSPDFTGAGLGLLFVMFAFSGWNGATYMAEEIKDPVRNLPKAMLLGTALTLVLYIIMNFIYYMSVPAQDMAWKDTVASLAATALFGKKVQILLHAGFCIILLSTISAQIMIGPRVYFAMARDKMFFNVASRVSPRFDTPLISIVFQTILTILYILSGNVKTIAEFMTFALLIFPVVTVIGLLYMNYKNKEMTHPYRSPLYPLFPLIFIVFSLLIMGASLHSRPYHAGVAISVVLIGVPAFLIWQDFKKSGAKILISLRNLLLSSSIVLLILLIVFLRIKEAASQAH